MKILSSPGIGEDFGDMLRFYLNAGYKQLSLDSSNGPSAEAPIGTSQASIQHYSNTMLGSG